MTRLRLMLATTAVVALAATACGGEAATDVAADGGGAAAGACLAGAEDCQDTGGDMGAPPPSDGELPVNPDEPVTGTAEPGADGDQPGATEVEPTDGLEDVRAVGWDSVEVNPDDQTEVTVFWTSGVAPCNALSEVTAEFSDEAVTLTVFEGTVPSDEPQACIEIAQMKRTTITLDEEVGPRSILDGAE